MITNKLINVATRHATPDDAGFFSELVFQASPEYLTLYGTNTENVMSHMFRKSGNLFSHKHAHIAEHDNTPSGMILGYSYTSKQTQSVTTALEIVYKTELKILGAVPFFLEFGHLIGKFKPGEHFISNIAVKSECRGTGAGRALLETFEKKAATAGSKRTVLEVNIQNSGAIAFYIGAGYKTFSEFTINFFGEKKHYARMAKTL